MGLGTVIELTTATVTEPTDVTLKATYNPIDSNINIKANVNGVDGEAISFSSDGVLAIPPVGTLTAMSLDVQNYDGFKTMLIQDYGRYMQEFCPIAVSSA